MWRFVVVSVVGMLLALSNLWYGQHEYQKCVADYLAQDAAARTIRSDASTNTINALVDQARAFAVATDPKHQPPSKEAVNAALESIVAVPREAEEYNDSIKKYPYPEYTCGGTTPGRDLTPKAKP